MAGRHRKRLLALEMVPVEHFLPSVADRRPGRPRQPRAPRARAFWAQMVLDLSTTTAWVREGPSAAPFSRMFKALAEADWPARRPAVRIEPGEADPLVGPLSREAPPIEAREQPAPQEKVVRPKRQRGCPHQGEERPKGRSWLARQRTMNREERLAELSKPCTVGVQRRAKGYKHSWTGYQRPMDGADGGIPVCCMGSSASRHDRQAAIPLMTKTAPRVRNR